MKQDGKNTSVRMPMPMPMTMWILLSLFRVDLDMIVNSQDGDGSLCGETEAFDLTERWLEHPALDVVYHFSLHEVEPQEAEILLPLHGLGGGVFGYELGD